MGRTLIESIDASMSEMFRCHDYRSMYDYYEKIIRPIIAECEQKKIEIPTNAPLTDVCNQRELLIAFACKFNGVSIEQFRDYFGKRVDEFLNSK